MASAKRQFDRNKYLNSPHAEPTPAQAARQERARERARNMRPVQFWLRAAASLALATCLWLLVGWFADWSSVRTGIWLAVSAVLWVATTVLAARWFYGQRH